MSKGLEALCYLDDIANRRKMNLDPHKLKLIVEKELKALEIIKNKRVDINLLLNCPDSEIYNEILEARDRPERFRLTQKEYKLLKEVLE